MSNGDKWMPLYVADYLGDTMHLTTLQHGAYMLLLMHYWKTGPLPTDPEELAAITKLDAASWQAAWAKLSGFFTVNGDGTLHQKRMDWERQRWTDISDKRRDAGRRGAEAKHRSRPNGGGGSPTPSPEPPKEQQPKVVNAYIAPGQILANATILPTPLPDMPVDKSVDNLANATHLPDGLPPTLPGVSGNCHPFATTFASVPLPSQRKNTYLSSLRKVTPREAEATQTGGNLPKQPSDALKELLSTLPPIGEQSGASAKRHTPDVQKAVVVKPVRPKACPLQGPQLAAARKLAGIMVAA